MIGAIIGGIATLGKQWLTNRKRVSDAKAEQKITRIQQDGSIAIQLTQGLKDEWWTLILTFPYLVGYWGVVSNNPEIIERSREMFETLTVLVPREVWSTATIISVVVSFGGRVSDVLDRFGWGGKK